MRKLFFAIVAVLLLNLSIISAHEHNFNEAKQLIDSEINCDKLTDEQLEAMGDYYMEQMHPGEAHEMMDQMVGGEGSESLKQMHIQMAKRLYCNEDVGGMMGGDMMNMMIGNNMVGSSGMNMMGSGMMGNWGYFGYGNFVNILYVMLLIGLIVLVSLWIIKLWKDLSKKGRR